MFCFVAAYACDRGAPQEKEAPSQEASGAAQKMSAQGPGTIEADFNPSVPAAWDSRDPETELVGREALLDYLNDLRARHGLSPVTWDDKLQAAAESHARYIKDNKAAIDAAGTNIHLEDPALPGFTGETNVLRGEHFGYGGKCFAEVIAFKPTAVGAARSWAESLYHRFPLLEESAVHVGYAELQLEATKVNVMEVGSNAP